MIFSQSGGQPAWEGFAGRKYAYLTMSAISFIILYNVILYRVRVTGSIKLGPLQKLVGLTAKQRAFT